MRNDSLFEYATRRWAYSINAIEDILHGAQGHLHLRQLEKPRLPFIATFIQLLHQHGVHFFTTLQRSVPLKPLQIPRK